MKIFIIYISTNMHVYLPTEYEEIWRINLICRPTHPTPPQKNSAVKALLRVDLPYTTKGHFRWLHTPSPNYVGIQYKKKGDMFVTKVFWICMKKNII